MNNYCIISHKYKFIYIPIPKVACTTLLNRVAEIIHSSNINKLRTKSHRDIHLKRKEIFNSNESAVCHEVELAVKEYCEYFKFAFTRNPFTRIHSCYIDKISYDTYGFDNNLISRYQKMHRGMSFFDFLKTVLEMPIDEMDEHFRPQYTFLPFESLDFIGTLENIDEHWSYIESRIKISHKPLPHFNKTQEVDNYTVDSENMVRKIYYKDFKLFNYKHHRNFKKKDAAELPISITSHSDMEIYPFKEAFLEKQDDSYIINISGNDSRIIIPYFPIRKGKALRVQINVNSPKNTYLTLYYTTEDATDNPESKRHTAKLVRGSNLISIVLTNPLITGRLRLKLSSKPGIFKIKSIDISEQTRPWLEDKDELTEINQKIFSLPRYTQNHKNLFSMVNYASLYLPLLKALRPKSICEIGCDAGNNSKLLSEFCYHNDCHLDIVDPILPSKSDILDDSHVAFHQQKSVDYLKNSSKASCVYFIDGDHNYSAVKQELNLINEMAEKANYPLCLFMHDTSWPWAYRDLYYSPKMDAQNKIKYTSKGSISLYASIPCDSGLPIAKYSVIKKDGGEQNGVRKAIEDFLEKNNSWENCSIPSLYGLTVLWTPDKLSKQQKQFFESTLLHFSYFKDFLSILEWNRLALYCRIQDMDKILEKRQEELLRLRSVRGFLDNLKQKAYNLLRNYLA